MITAELDKWDSFYVIIGSAAGALIGLQFVVMTLIAERPAVRAEAGAAFSTPTIVHFSAVLLISALLRAPWEAEDSVAGICGLLGFCGVAYGLLTAWRMRVQTSYKPDFEDWLFLATLPLASYAGFAACAFFFADHLRQALFGVAGATLLLLYSAIHNAWDAVSYQVFVNRGPPKSE